jgi:hypothetical protein
MESVEISVSCIENITHTKREMVTHGHKDCSPAASIIRDDTYVYVGGSFDDVATWERTRPLGRVPSVPLNYIINSK